MKSVWILEKWVSAEDMQASLKGLESVFGSEDLSVTAYREKIETNPEGMWSGWEGKSDYKQFCKVAKDALRRSKKGDKFRVVKAEIEDSAEYWTGYENPVENVGVMKYLWATK